MNTFFTSDTHFGHGAIIRYCARPFSSVEEMNETIIQNWNAKVRPGDWVYHCGDFMFGKREKILEMTRRLSGNIILIEGNHDRIGDPISYGFKAKYSLLDTKINGIYISLCHYAMRVWNRSHFNTWLCFGHSHGTLPAEGKSWDVGVDNNGFFPVEFEELKVKMDSQPDNFNWVGRLPGYNQREFESAKKEELNGISSTEHG